MLATAIIPAAGEGTRVRAGKNKLLLSLGEKSVLEVTLEKFIAHPKIQKILLCIAPVDREEMQSLFRSSKISLIEGGRQRQDSVYNALQFIQSMPVQPQVTLVHDGARPFCSTALITEVILESQKRDSVVPVIPITDTLRHQTPQQVTVVDRSEYVATQTPQGFKTPLLLEAYEKASQENWTVTDDASIMEKCGYPTPLVEGSVDNIKITTASDLQWAQWKISNI